MESTPFSDDDVFSAFGNRMQQLTAEIRGLENGYVLRTTPTELEQFYLDKARFEPLTLHTDDYHIEDPRSVEVDARLHIPGTQLTIAIPFEGDSQRLMRPGWCLGVSQVEFSGIHPSRVSGSEPIVRRLSTELAS